MSDRFKPAALLAATVLCAHAQWLHYPAPGTPRTRDGQPNLTAAAPRASNGKPDLSGVWQTEPAAPGENQRLFGRLIDIAVPGDDPSTFPRYAINVLADFKPADSPLRPEALEQLRKNPAARRDPAVVCLPMGLPMADVFNFAPFKMIQTPGVIAVLYEADNTYRQIYTDGRKLPDDPEPAWLGYSVGTWDGDTLVVDAAGFNLRSRLDLMGHLHSDGLRIQERFHRRDFGHMDVSITLDDPIILSRPVTFQVTEDLIPDSDILETVCNENEKDRAHLPKP